MDDTLTIMPDRVTADHFLRTLDHCHSSVRFTMETEHDGSLPFLGVELLNRAPKIETKVYIKPTNTGLKVQEAKPSTVNQQCVVYKFKCNLCDAGYVGYTRGQLHARRRTQKEVVFYLQTLPSST